MLAAAGDHGAADGGGDGQVHADFPASSPHIVACGGTTLIASRGKIASEVVWNDSDGWATGGGISSAFKVPAYQQGISMPANLDGSGKPGRGVPDIAGNADSVSGYIADLLRREDDWRDARATLDRMFERCPDPEAKHYAWARQVLGVGPKPAA